MCNRGATKDLISRYRSAMIVHCIRAFCDHDPTLEQGYALNEEIPAAMTDNGESKTSAWTLQTSVRTLHSPNSRRRWSSAWVPTVERRCFRQTSDNPCGIY